VRTVRDHVAGPEQAARFAGVLAGDMIPRKKPAPDIYELALERIGAEPSDALVIEDSGIGLAAATGAGMRCVVTVNAYTEDEDFGEAALVVSSLGDPGGERTRVLANRSRGAPGDWVTLRDLEDCFEG
jgi:beta-phosphoglucomutase-like phosphatase (HAD superfamily)